MLSSSLWLFFFFFPHFFSWQCLLNRTRFSILMKSILSVGSFMDCAFNVVPKFFFFFMFSSQSFIVWVLHFFANWYHLFGPICWRGYLFATELPFHFCWKSVNIRVGLYLDCIVFHWSLCLSLCQYHSVLMAIIL